MSEVSRQRDMRRNRISRRRNDQRRPIEGLEDRLFMAAHITGSSTVYSTIQAAVNAAAAGATITVDPGTYAERVTVNKSLTLLGAEANVDARSNIRQAGVSESTVTGAVLSDNTISCAFRITANDVTLNGFTVQGNTSDNILYGAGIVIAPGVSGTHIVNNIIQNNVAGLYLANSSNTDAAIIQDNVFSNNNNSGLNDGRGIYTDGTVSGGTLTNVTIDNNYFTHNFGATGVEAAIGLEGSATSIQSNIRITNNVMDSNGKALLAYNATGLVITGNVATYGHDTPSGVLRFEGGDTNITISGNLLYDSPGAAIRIDNKASENDNSGFTITGNNIYGDGVDTSHEGLIVNAGQYSGTLKAQNNYWGSATGPGGDGTGTGNGVFANGNLVTYTPFATAPVGTTELPYFNLASVAGAPIQAENFDHGGLSVAYNYAAAINESQPYRPYENVALETTGDVGGGYDVTKTLAGETINYTINVATTAAYRLDFRVASAQATGGTFHVNIDGQDVTGPITIPNTGGDQIWQTISQSGVVLPAGQHVLQLSLDTPGSGGYVGNFNWIQFAAPGTATVPSAPSNLAALGLTPTQINLSWTNNDAHASSFIVQRSTDDMTFTTVASNLSATSFADTGLTAGITYYYQVFDTNAVGSSTGSNIASAVTLPATAVPTPISSLTWVSATTGFGTIQKNLSINGNPLKLRGVTYATGIGTHAASQIVYNLAGNYQSFISDVGVDDEVTGVGSVDFQVIGDGKLLFDSGVVTNTVAAVHIAVSVAGVKQLTLVANNGIAGSIDYDHSDWAGAELFGIPAVPAAPSNLAASVAVAGQINLSWTNNAGNQTGFTLARSTDNVTFTPLPVTLPATATSYTDTGLAGSQIYYYQVFATNAVGSSLPSNTANATTLPAAATTTYLSDLNWVSATTGFGTIHKDASINGNPITLRGNVYAKGIGTHASSTIVYNLGGNYTRFISAVGVDDEEKNAGLGSVEFKVIGDGKTLFDSGVVTGNSPVVNINIDISGVQQLSLLAINGVAGSIDYDHSDWAGAAVIGVPAVPAAPGNLAASVSTVGQINLTWTNNASNQTGFTLARSTDNVTFTPLPIALPTAATSYTDTGLAGSTPYYYQVFAVDGVGPSAPSNTATATTLPATATTTYLSDLQWVSATTGFGTIHKDATINGNPITLRGTAYAKGIGTHASSTIIYNLGGNYSKFLSAVGVDDEENSAGIGSVDFQVVGDGKVLFDSGVVTNQSAVVNINIDVTGVQQLTLIAANGVAGNINYDHSDWAGAALIGVPAVPAAPSNLAATVSDVGVINLAWTNNASNQTGFTIARSTDNLTFTPLPLTLPATATSYTDTGLAGSQTYYYQVFATNAVGSSLASNTASATTFPANSVTTYVSDLNWVSATTGFGTIHKNASINGNPITLRGTVYAKGIGTHASSTIIYNLGGAYATFLSSVGVDDEENGVGVGSVDFKVVGDGITLFDSGVLTNNSPVVNINISVVGVQQLSLIATNGVAGNINYDHSDWANARLLSTPAQPGVVTAGLTQLSPSLGTGTSSPARTISASQIVNMVGPALPAGWTNASIGAISVLGSASESAGLFTIAGAGSGIGRTSDSLDYAYQTLSGNGSVVAHLTSAETGDDEAGLMIRESLGASSKQAALLLTTKNVKFLHRAKTGGADAASSTKNGVAPQWLRLVRKGNTFTAYDSVDGLHWKKLGSSSIKMNAMVDIGLAVTSQQPAALNTATFSDVTIA